MGKCLQQLTFSKVLKSLFKVPKKDLYVYLMPDKIFKFIIVMDDDLKMNDAEYLSQAYLKRRHDIQLQWIFFEKSGIIMNV